MHPAADRAWRQRMVNFRELVNEVLIESTLDSVTGAIAPFPRIAGRWLGHCSISPSPCSGPCER